MKHIARKTYINVFILSLFLLPLFANAESFREFINNRVLVIFYPLVVLISGLALLFFLWGIAQFIFHAGDETKRTEGKQRMIWGIIGLFVLFSVWGLVSVLIDTFFVGPIRAPF